MKVKVGTENADGGWWVVCGQPPGQSGLCQYENTNKYKANADLANIIFFV